MNRLSPSVIGMLICPCRVLGGGRERQDEETSRAAETERAWKGRRGATACGLLPQHIRGRPTGPEPGACFFFFFFFIAYRVFRILNPPPWPCCCRSLASRGRHWKAMLCAVFCLGPGTDHTDCTGGRLEILQGFPGVPAYAYRRTGDRTSLQSLQSGKQAQGQAGTQQLPGDLQSRGALAAGGAQGLSCL